MNLYLRYCMVVIATFSVTGCIKPEAANMEADILGMELPDSVVKSGPVITNSSIAAFVDYQKLDLTSVAPNFTLSPGAHMEPRSGTPQDFSNPVIYTVFSEDGRWQKQYRVSLLRNAVADSFMFESWQLDPDNQFYTPYEIVFGEQQEVWASGNSGFALLATQKVPEAYPTQRTTEAVQGNYAALLVTQSTGAIGAIVGMPIAAGNLFLGTFDGSKAMTAPLKATQFGIPYNKKPLRLRGNYRYVSGGAVMDKTSTPVVPERQDECHIYAVLFHPTANSPYLDGANVLTADNVIATAVLEDGAATSGSGYHTFDIPFIFKQEIDEAILEGFGYRLTLVFTSSKNGGNFEGAVDSKLYIDNVHLITE